MIERPRAARASPRKDELGQRSLVDRLIQMHLAAARETETGDTSEALVRDTAEELHSSGSKRCDVVVEVVAHQVEAVDRVLRAGMDGELRWRLSKDQPAIMRVHVSPAEHVTKKRPIGLGVSAEDDGVHAPDHRLEPTTMDRRSVSGSLCGRHARIKRARGWLALPVYQPPAASTLALGESPRPGRRSRPASSVGSARGLAAAYRRAGVGAEASPLRPRRRQGRSPGSRAESPQLRFLTVRVEGGEAQLFGPVANEGVPRWA